MLTNDCVQIHYCFTFLGGVTIYREKNKVSEVTLKNTLTDSYTATLSRLRAQKEYKSVVRLKVLMWVLSITSLGTLSHLWGGDRICGSGS